MQTELSAEPATVEDAPKLHLWLAWREMASPEGWLMPIWLKTQRLLG
jgi:hypothetical protein